MAAMPDDATLKQAGFHRQASREDNLQPHARAGAVESWPPQDDQGCCCGHVDLVGNGE